MSYLDDRKKQKETGIVPKKKKKKYRISRYAEKRKLQNEKYFELRDVFLKENPMCGCGRDGCRKKSQDVHHSRKRGKYLLDISTWIAVNRLCHIWIHGNPVEAKNLGLIK